MKVVKENQLKYLHSFNLIQGIGPITFQKIINYFNSPEEAWKANFEDFYKANLNKNIIEKIKQYRLKINPEQEIKKLEQENIKILFIENENYPKLLKQIYSPPAIIYVKGEIKPEDEISIGIVGTRKLSTYGYQITPKITSELVQNGLTIISGLAKGIDTLAHKNAIENGGRTIAVLGSGVDFKSIYPAINKKLAEKVIQNGALISEFPPGTTPLPGNFPRRNRIISGLSLGIMVIEAPIKSGALITARDALEQNREVFATPGHILSVNSKGPHKLIKLGAKLAETAEDIIEELNLPKQNPIQQKKANPADKEEDLIIKELSKTNEPIHIDKIIQKTKLPITIVNSKLSLMEIRGKVRNLGSGKYSL